VHPDILFVTLDSCRYDAFAAAHAPNLKSVGSLHRAKSPSHFTFGAHAAFFMGFTPGVADIAAPYVNPKFGKIFRMNAGGFSGMAKPRFDLDGPNIIEGLRRLGFAAIGTGAVGWFDPGTATGRVLTDPFEEFYFPGNSWSLGAQLRWIDAALAKRPSPHFVFLNIGETHVPYFHEGAPWDRQRNPCVPFRADNDAVECRRRQTACIEFVDSALASLLDRFAEGLIIVCGDHGDAWGEGGLWEHGISHDVVLEVPLLLRLPSAE
jgi:hypothetical protein